MAGGIYQRGEIWWCWWTEKVKDPKRGVLRSKKNYASSQSTRKSDAVTLLSTKIHQARLQKPSLDLPDPTYEEVRDLWIASKPNMPRRKDGTAYFDGRSHLDAFFSGWKAKDIDTPDIITLQEVLQQKGLRNGVDHTVVSLRTMLHYAVKINRLRREQLPGSFPMLRFKRKAPRPIEEDCFEPICKHLPEPFKTGFIISYHTGMRLSEVERLRWEHVNLKKRCLYFPSAKTKDEERLVPLLAGTDKLLAKLSKTGDLVLPGFDDRSARARAWREAAKAAGLEGVQMRYTRTTFIRRLTNMGVPLVRIMQATGHKNVPTHMGYNVADEKDLDLIRKLYDGKKM